MPCLAISDLIFSAALSVISIMHLHAGSNGPGPLSFFDASAGTEAPAYSSWGGASAPPKPLRRRLGVRPGRRRLLVVLLLLVVRNGRLDGVLCQDRAVNLHRRQRELGD